MTLHATRTSPAADEQLQSHLFDLWLSLCSRALDDDATGTGCTSRSEGPPCRASFEQATLEADDRSARGGAA